MLKTDFLIFLKINNTEMNISNQFPRKDSSRISEAKHMKTGKADCQIA